MAIEWDWNRKIGTATLQQGEKTFELDLYQGNSFLIMINEWTDDEGTDKYELVSFFVRKDHAKNCLGLNKKGGYTENILDREWSKITKVRINKARYSYTKDLVTMLVQAFDNLIIEIYTEE